MVYFNSVERTVREISYYIIGEDICKVLAGAFDADVCGAPAGVLDAIGAELLLAALFCSGFAFFRLAVCQHAARRALGPRPAPRKRKEADALGGPEPRPAARGGAAAPPQRAGPRPQDPQPVSRGRGVAACADRCSGAAAGPNGLAVLLEARPRGPRLPGLSDAWGASCEDFVRRHIVSGSGCAAEAFDELRRHGYCPGEPALALLVGLCVDSRHVLMAERLLSCAREAHGRVTLSLYTAMMRVYSGARLWHKACGLYKEMRAEGVELDTVMYGCVIKAAVESGRVQLARRLFKESGNPDLLNCMSLIRAAGHEGDVPKALGLLEGLEQSPVEVDTTAYNCVLEVCAVSGDLPEARKLLRRMEGTGHVDVVSYNTYIKALLASGAVDEAEAALEEMRRRSLAPNTVTYNSLVKGAIAAKDAERAWQLVADMEQVGVQPDAFTCSILVKGAKHAPQACDVDRVIALMKRASVVPDEVLINCLLDTCVRIRDVHRLSQVLDQFRATGVVPSPHAHATLLRAYGHAQRPEQAWALWRELTSPSGAQPSEEVFVSMVEACLAVWDIAGAVSVFDDARESLARFARAASAFSALVRAAVQTPQVRLAVALYGRIKCLVVCTRVTFNTLIDVLARQGDAAGANELFRDMSLNNVEPDLITFSTLIKGHCAAGDIEQGLRLLGLMQRRGIAPDSILFNSILDGCAHRQMRGLTEQVLHDMEAAGVPPSNFTLSILVKLYSRCGDLEAAIGVVEEYPRKYRFKLNAQVYTCLMAACISHGRMATALEVHGSMKRAGCQSDAKTYHTLLSGCIRHGNLEGAVALLDDALGRAPPVRPSREVAEGVLLMAQRRGRAADLALPLLARLQAAGVAVSERVARGLPRQAGRAAPGA